MRSFVRYATTRGHRHGFLKATPKQGVAGCRFLTKKAYLRSVLETGEDESQQQDYEPSEETQETSSWENDEQFHVEENNKYDDDYSLSCFPRPRSHPLLNTIDEVITNWDRVLEKLNRANLKVSPNKVRILLDDTEVYGFRIKQGHVLPSQHSVDSLGAVKIDGEDTCRAL